MTPETRNRYAARFRDFIGRTCALYPFRHQAAWDLASRGLELTGTLDVPAEKPHIVIRDQDLTVTRAGVRPRPGGVATVLADLGAFKCGKSWGGARWLAGFAACPGAKVDLVGMQYDIVMPEFEYLAEFLLADRPRGLCLPYTSYFSSAKTGRLEIEIATTGARFEGRSWERKEMLKGKERDCYYFCEAYQFPGLHAFTSIAQNLRKRQGFAAFPTTPDRPWVGIFHELGHGDRPEWHCTCGVHARENPLTFNQADFERDHPEIGGLMTREQFAVSWEGKLGVFVGRVYEYHRGQYTLSPEAHAHWWDPSVVRDEEDDAVGPV